VNLGPGQERGYAVVETWEKPDVAVYGLGYIGLPTAIAFAEAGKRVLGVDVNLAVVESLRQGRSHIAEEGIQDRLISALSSGRLQVSTEPGPADAHLVAVPTPATADHRADISYVESASFSIASVLAEGDLVVIESTVPPGTCERVVGPMIERQCGLKFGRDYDLAHCPERVIPGRIFLEIVENDRIVGGTTPEAASRAADLYRAFVTGDILLTDSVTAELAKLMENTYRDVNVALANEFAEVSRRHGADVFKAIALANRHPRVDILRPGIGVGGHCIPVDPWFLVESAPEEAKLIRTAREVNLSRTERIAERVVQALWQSKAHRAAFLGLTYKPDVDDFRESPAVEVVKAVRERWQGQVIVADPCLSSLPAELEGMGVEWRSLNGAIQEADFVVPLVSHRQVVQLDWDRLPNKTLFDPAGILPAKRDSAAEAVQARA